MDSTDHAVESFCETSSQEEKIDLQEPTGLYVRSATAGEAVKHVMIVTTTKDGKPDNAICHSPLTAVGLTIFAL